MARWNGHAPHTTTGEASVKASHCHSSNWRAGIIDMAITGMASAAVTSEAVPGLLDGLGVVVLVRPCRQWARHRGGAARAPGRVRGGSRDAQRRVVGAARAP